MAALATSDLDFPSTTIPVSPSMTASGAPPDVPPMTAIPHALASR